MVQMSIFPASGSVRRKTLASAGKFWGSFDPTRRRLVHYFYFPGATGFQLLAEFGVYGLFRLKSTGAGECRQV